MITIMHTSSKHEDFPILRSSTYPLFKTRTDRQDTLQRTNTQKVRTLMLFYKNIEEKNLALKLLNDKLISRMLP